MNNAPAIYAIFLVFILANLLMLPLGIAAIKGAKQMLRVPREVLLPVILLFCVVGSFAINNSMFGVVLMLGFGVVAYLMEENGFPVAPAILGMVLGAMLEENFISSMIKAEGHIGRVLRAADRGHARRPDDRRGRRPARSAVAATNTPGLSDAGHVG